MKSINHEIRAAVCKMPSTLESDLFLGVIFTNITGKKAGHAICSPGDRIVFVREKSNFSHPSAIRVEDNNQRPIGYVSRSVAKWLSPLLKAGFLRAEGEIPNRPGISTTLSLSSTTLLISLFRTSPNVNFEENKEFMSPKDVLHQLVYHAYRLAKSNREPNSIQCISTALRPLLRQELHPQTQLLIALLPGLSLKISE